MEISATIKNDASGNFVNVETMGQVKSLNIPAKPGGKGSSVNGGELLCLAIATCFCNDIYREAAKRNIVIVSVEVTASGVFAREAEPGNDFRYEARIESNHPRPEIEELIQYVDSIAEIHNTVRRGARLHLKNN